MPTLAEQMVADALAAQKFTRKHFVTELDFTERSMQELEGQFDAVRYALRGGLSPENIANLTKLWGAYLGETLKRLGGGDWVSIQEGEQARIVLQSSLITLYPHDQVQTRLVEGPAHNVWTYFQTHRALLKQSEG